MSKKSFVPCYKMLVTYFDFDNCSVLRSFVFFLDYFKRDCKGRYFTSLIDDYFAIPWYRTFIAFERIC